MRARFDGFSIGSNDLTQLILGVDRDSAELAGLFDERDAAVKRMIVEVIGRAHRCGTKVGICGQAPSNYPEFAAFLVESGIDSISLNPDSFVATSRIRGGFGTKAGALGEVVSRRNGGIFDVDVDRSACFSGAGGGRCNDWRF